MAGNSKAGDTRPGTHEPAATNRPTRYTLENNKMELYRPIKKMRKRERLVGEGRKSEEKLQPSEKSRGLVREVREGGWALMKT